MAARKVHLARTFKRLHAPLMAYGDDFASPMQRRIASAAIMLALLQLAYCWLVAGMMAEAPNPRLTEISIVLGAIIILNCTLLFGNARPANHWLRVASWASIALMIAAPTALILAVYWFTT